MPLRNEPNFHLDIRAHELSRIWNINKGKDIGWEREKERENFLPGKAFQQKDHITVETICSVLLFEITKHNISTDL